MAAGFRGLFSRRRRVFTSRETVPVSARTRWKGIAGRSYVLLIIAPVRTFARSFCLRPEMIRQQPLERPDPVQQVELGGGVVAVITDGLADDVPVYLFHLCPVVLVPGAGPGERQVLM